MSIVEDTFHSGCVDGAAAQRDGVTSDNVLLECIAAGDQAALEIDAVVGDAKAKALGLDDWNGDADQAEEDQHQIDDGVREFMEIHPDQNRQSDQ